MKLAICIMQEKDLRLLIFDVSCLEIVIGISRDSNQIIVRSKAQNLLSKSQIPPETSLRVIGICLALNRGRGWPMVD